MKKTLLTSLLCLCLAPTFATNSNIDYSCVNNQLQGPLLLTENELTVQGSTLNSTDKTTGKWLDNQICFWLTPVLIIKKGVTVPPTCFDAEKGKTYVVALCGSTRNPATCFTPPMNPPSETSAAQFSISIIPGVAACQSKE